MGSQLERGNDMTYTYYTGDNTLLRNSGSRHSPRLEIYRKGKTWEPYPTQHSFYTECDEITLDEAKAIAEARENEQEAVPPGQSGDRKAEDTQ
jgi:hypothetical protein